MCGICGVYRFAKDEPVSTAGLEQMKAMLAHRGPNQHGTHLEPFVGLGHRRLSIIGVADGRQPLSNETGSVWITFNGEIYNYRPIRDRLLARGHSFKTTTDTEVLVHLYEEEGPALVDQLRGMFAIAIWDREREALLLIRDRLGKKPLYYAMDGRQVLFASELKAILGYPGVERAPNLEAIHHYLSLACVPAPLTAFAGIHSLPAGHLMEVTTRGASAPRPYWELRFATTSRTEEQCEAELDAAFEDAVRVRLESEVPLGVFLSGGVDSSAVAHRMARCLSRPVVSTTIKLDEPSWDESPYAGDVARLLGTEHHVERVGPGAASLLETIIWHFDEPFADSSALPTYLLCQAARRTLTVALSGDGGDELFAGYERYAQLAAEDETRTALPRMLRPLIAAVAAVYPAHARGKSWLEHLRSSPGQAAAQAACCFLAAEKRELYAGAMRRHLAASEATETMLERLFDGVAAPDATARAQALDYRTYLPDDILVKVDRMSMAHSLEVRSPLLDHRLIELVASFPTTTKLAEGRGKRIFKRLLERHLPASIVYRKKQGFGMPLAAWFRGGLQPLVADILLDGRLAARGYFDQRRIEALWRRQQTGTSWTTDLGGRLWTLLQLELWHRMYIDRPRFLEPPAGRAGAAAAEPAVLAGSGAR